MPKAHPNPETAPSGESNEIVVFMVRRETKCVECGRELFDGEMLRLEANRPLCRDGADPRWNVWRMRNNRPASANALPSDARPKTANTNQPWPAN